METELYSTIEYTPGWYYTKYPKFWNIDCYKVLSDYSNNPEKYMKDEDRIDPVKDKEEQEDSGVEEQKTCVECDSVCDMHDLQFVMEIDRDDDALNKKDVN
jgi:hypothetical protein